jgi:hypothetical protein
MRTHELHTLRFSQASEVEKRKGQSREKYQPYATSFVSHIVNWCMFSTALLAPEETKGLFY